MRKPDKLSPNASKVFELLNKSAKPLSAYEIMERLNRFGIKAPPTVYRALDSLTEKGLVHKIESLNAFVSCHNECKEHIDEHGAQFAVCRNCGLATEIHDHRLSDIIKDISRKVKFHIEHEVLELQGLCDKCYKKSLS